MAQSTDLSVGLWISYRRNRKPYNFHPRHYLYWQPRWLQRIHVMALTPWPQGCVRVLFKATGWIHHCRKKFTLMLNIVLYCHQHCMWLGQCYGMDCPRCLCNHVPPTKPHMLSMLKYFSVQNAVMFCKCCHFLFVITETAHKFYSHTVTLSLQLPKWFKNQTDHRSKRW